MAKQPTLKALEEYREALLTDPHTFKQKLNEARETLRQRVEALFIDYDLTQNDDDMEEDFKVVELENLARAIQRVGKRIDAIDAALAESLENEKQLFTLARREQRVAGEQNRAARRRTLKLLRKQEPVEEKEEEE